MEIRLYDSELKLMELIWEKKTVNARDLSRLAEERIGWNKNTTYTILKKLVEKGYVSRKEPGFICRPLLSREEAQRHEAKGLINRLFGGSRDALFSALIEEEKLSESEIRKLRALIDGR